MTDAIPLGRFCVTIARREVPYRCADGSGKDVYAAQILMPLDVWFWRALTL